MKRCFTVFLCWIAYALIGPVNAFDEWPRASLDEAGFDRQKVETLIEDLREDRLLPGLHSMLIVRNGNLVVEEYFDGWRADEPHMMQSVSKSITSALVGIAISRGEFSSIDEKVVDFFPDYEIRHFDERKQAISIEDLLTMQSGTDYNEAGVGSPHYELNRLTTAWDRFYLNRPMDSVPGTRFQYDSGAVIVMSSLIQRRTGMHADEYAARYLFKPLDINAHWWVKNAEGHPHTGGGLYLTPRGMAKFGLLYLQKGRWGDVQVLPESWVEASISQNVTFDRRRWYNRGVGYGYWWWIMEPDPEGRGEATIFAALGSRGQHIFVVPEHGLVAVFTAGIGYGMHRPVDVLYTDILPAIIKRG